MKLWLDASKRDTKDYEGLRWSSWRTDLQNLSSDECFAFYPFLWTREGSVERSHRSKVPITQAFEMKVDILTQLCDDS